MSVRIVFPHHWQTQAWQNGGGITHELIKDANTPWRYRLSIAEVAQDGPFSHFDGVDRIIMLLQGHGFELGFGGGHVQTLATVFEPFSFRGEDPVQCELIDGAVRDFNVMVRRENASASAQVLPLSATRQALPCGDLLHAVFVLQGRVLADSDQHGHIVETHHLLLLENEATTLQLSALSDTALVYSIAICART